MRRSLGRNTPETVHGSISCITLVVGHPAPRASPRPSARAAFLDGIPGMRCLCAVSGYSARLPTRPVCKLRRLTQPCTLSCTGPRCFSPSTPPLRVLGERVIHEHAFVPKLARHRNKVFAFIEFVFVLVCAERLSNCFFLRSLGASKMCLTRLPIDIRPSGKPGQTHFEAVLRAGGLQDHGITRG